MVSYEISRYQVSCIIQRLAILLYFLFITQLCMMSTWTNYPSAILAVLYYITARDLGMPMSKEMRWIMALYWHHLFLLFWPFLNPLQISRKFFIHYFVYFFGEWWLTALYSSQCIIFYNSHSSWHNYISCLTYGVYQCAYQVVSQVATSTICYVRSSYATKWRIWGMLTYGKQIWHPLQRCKS